MILYDEMNSHFILSFLWMTSFSEPPNDTCSQEDFDDRLLSESPSNRFYVKAKMEDKLLPVNDIQEKTIMNSNRSISRSISEPSIPTFSRNQITEKSLFFLRSLIETQIAVNELRERSISIDNQFVHHENFSITVDAHNMGNSNIDQERGVLILSEDLISLRSYDVHGESDVRRTKNRQSTSSVNGSSDTAEQSQLPGGQISYLLHTAPILNNSNHFNSSNNNNTFFSIDSSPPRHQIYEHRIPNKQHNNHSLPNAPPPVVANAPTPIIIESRVSSAFPLHEASRHSLFNHENSNQVVPLQQQLLSPPDLASNGENNMHTTAAPTREAIRALLFQGSNGGGGHLKAPPPSPALQAAASNVHADGSDAIQNININSADETLNPNAIRSNNELADNDCVDNNEMPLLSLADRQTDSDENDILLQGRLRISNIIDENPNIHVSALNPPTSENANNVTSTIINPDNDNNNNNNNQSLTLSLELLDAVVSRVISLGQQDYSQGSLLDPYPSALGLLSSRIEGDGSVQNSSSSLFPHRGFSRNFYTFYKQRLRFIKAEHKRRRRQQKLQNLIKNDIFDGNANNNTNQYCVCCSALLRVHQLPEFGLNSLPMASQSAAPYVTMGNNSIHGCVANNSKSSSPLHPNPLTNETKTSNQTPLISSSHSHHHPPLRTVRSRASYAPSSSAVSVSRPPPPAVFSSAPSITGGTLTLAAAPTDAPSPLTGSHSVSVDDYLDVGSVRGPALPPPVHICASTLNVHDHAVREGHGFCHCTCRAMAAGTAIPLGNGDGLNQNAQTNDDDSLKRNLHIVTTLPPFSELFAGANQMTSTVDHKVNGRQQQLDSSSHLRSSPIFSAVLGSMHHPNFSRNNNNNYKHDVDNENNKNNLSLINCYNDSNGLNTSLQQSSTMEDAITNNVDDECSYNQHRKVSSDEVIPPQASTTTTTSRKITTAAIVTHLLLSPSKFSINPSAHSATNTDTKRKEQHQQQHQPHILRNSNNNNTANIHNSISPQNNSASSTFHGSYLPSHQHPTSKPLSQPPPSRSSPPSSLPPTPHITRSSSATPLFPRPRTNPPSARVSAGSSMHPPLLATQAANPTLPPLYPPSFMPGDAHKAGPIKPIRPPPAVVSSALPPEETALRSSQTNHTAVQACHCTCHNQGSNIDYPSPLVRTHWARGSGCATPITGGTAQHQECPANLQVASSMGRQNYGQLKSFVNSTIPPIQPHNSGTASANLNHTPWIANTRQVLSAVSSLLESQHRPELSATTPVGSNHTCLSFFSPCDVFLSPVVPLCELCATGNRVSHAHHHNHAGQCPCSCNNTHRDRTPLNEIYPTDVNTGQSSIVIQHAHALYNHSNHHHDDSKNYYVDLNYPSSTCPTPSTQQQQQQQPVINITAPSSNVQSQSALSSPPPANNIANPPFATQIFTPNLLPPLASPLPLSPTVVSSASNNRSNIVASLMNKMSLVTTDLTANSWLSSAPSSSQGRHGVMTTTSGGANDVGKQTTVHSGAASLSHHPGGKRKIGGGGSLQAWRGGSRRLARRMVSLGTANVATSNSVNNGISSNNGKSTSNDLIKMTDPGNSEE